MAVRKKKRKPEKEYLPSVKKGNDKIVPKDDTSHPSNSYDNWYNRRMW